MSSLHIINSPKAPSELTSILATVGAKDSILLIQDACYLLKSPQTLQLLQSLEQSCYALQTDMQARNSLVADKNEHTDQGIQAIDYNQFVELTLAHQNSISW